MRVTVIGTGYLGAVHAAAMAELGHDVVGVDTDQQLIEILAAGRAPFYEPGFGEMLARNVAAGRLRFTTSLAQAAVHGDVHFVCVGTPQQARSDAADLRYVDAVFRDLAPMLTRRCVVVGKSTVPVGTAERMAGVLAAAPAADKVTLVWNPEFLREGFAVADTLRPDRIVVGVTANGDDAALAELYAPMIEEGSGYIVTDYATAELVKVAANSFLATKISFINAMAEVCEATGADVTTLAVAIGQDARIGAKFLRSGVGFGGGCLGKDIRAFQARVTELGLPDTLAFLRDVDAINSRRRDRVVRLATDLIGDLDGQRIAVLGAAFKPNSDDVRDSPALAVAAMLAARGANVRVHDPAALDNARAARPELDYADDVEKVVEGACLVVHLTEWSDYQRLDPARLAALVAEPNLLDGRNALVAELWQAAGWRVAALGRSL